MGDHVGVQIACPVQCAGTFSQTKFYSNLAHAERFFIVWNSYVDLVSTLELSHFVKASLQRCPCSGKHSARLARLYIYWVQDPRPCVNSSVEQQPNSCPHHLRLHEMSIRLDGGIFTEHPQTILIILDWKSFPTLVGCPNRCSLYPSWSL